MDALTVISLFLAGLIAGVLAWTRIARTAFALSRNTRDLRTSTPLSEPLKRSALRIVLSIAGIWLVIFGGVTFYLYDRDAHAGWVWFLGAMTLTPFMVVTNFLLVLRRVNKRASKGVAL